MTPHQSPDDPIVLAQTQTEFEARTIVVALEAEGVRSYIAGGDAAVVLGMGSAGAAWGQPFRVMVRRDESERARAALSRHLAESVDIDWDSVDVGEMEEGGAPGLRPNRRLLLLALLMVGLAAAAFKVLWDSYVVPT
jgi:hypothetical protein